MEKKKGQSYKLDTREIKNQFARLEDVTAEFSDRVFKLKQEQEAFIRFMKNNNLFH
ncbi:MAG: hypothetical protein HC913_05415 [Microscillaceae bacterium]|nr:hypothetical protein [Microscillaceae bacterium]